MADKKKNGDTTPTASPHSILLGDIQRKVKHKLRSIGSTLSGVRATSRLATHAKYTGDEASDVDVENNVPNSMSPLHRKESPQYSNGDFMRKSTEELNMLYSRKQLDEQQKQASQEQLMRKTVQDMCDIKRRDAIETSIQTLFNVQCNHVLVPGFYFLLGAFLATPSLAINYFAIRVLSINPGSFGALYGFVVMPWFAKSVFGLISDTRPLFGKNRSPYLVVCSFLSTAVWVALSVPGAHSRTCLGFGLLMFLSNVFICFCDVIADCFVASAARDEMETSKKGNSQTKAWFMRHTGSLFGIVLGGYLVAHTENLHHVFAVTAIFPCALFVGSFFLREESYTDQSLSFTASSSLRRVSLLSHLRIAFSKVAKNKVLTNLAKFIFITASTPNSGLTFTYFLINKLKFDESFMAVLSVVGTLATILGLVVYSFFLVNVATRKLIKIGIVLSTLLALMPLMLITRFNRTIGIDDRFFALGDDVAESFASQLSMMPIMLTIASVCPEGDEGLVYAGFLSISNFGGAVSTWIGAALTHVLGITKQNYDNMFTLVVLCTVTNFIPFFFLHYVPQEAKKRTPIE